MLEALERAASELEWLADFHNTDEGIFAALDVVKNAIRKAKGE
jgi:hypothetical protein